MATTGELRAIIEELQLIDIGDATSYLGEEMPVAEESLETNLQQEDLSGPHRGLCYESIASSREESSFK